MRIEIVKVDHYDATVKFIPNMLQRVLFRMKMRIEQYYLSDAKFRITGECAWYSYVTGEVVSSLSNLHSKLHNARRVHQNKRRAPL